MCIWQKQVVVGMDSENSGEKKNLYLFHINCEISLFIWNFIGVDRFGTINDGNWYKWFVGGLPVHGKWNGQ